MFSFSMSSKTELTWLIPSDCNVLMKHWSWLCSPKSHTFWAISRSPNVAWMKKTVITKNALILILVLYFFSFVSSFLIYRQNSSFIFFFFFFVCQTKSFCVIFVYFSFTLYFHNFFFLVFLLFLWKKKSQTSVLFNRWATTELNSVLLPVSSNEFSCCCWSNWANTVWHSWTKFQKIRQLLDLKKSWKLRIILMPSTIWQILNVQLACPSVFFIFMKHPRKFGPRRSR